MGLHGNCGLSSGKLGEWCAQHCWTRLWRARIFKRASNAHGGRYLIIRQLAMSDRSTVIENWEKSQIVLMYWADVFRILMHQASSCLERLDKEKNDVCSKFTVLLRSQL